MTKTTKILMTTLAMLLICSTTQAQFGSRLGNAAKRAAENAAIRKTEQKVDEAVSKGIDKATDPNSYKEDNNNKDSRDKTDNKDKGDNNNQSSVSQESSKPQTPQTPQKAAEMAYAKSDFVAGDVIFFEDDQANEKLGEFPSMWDLNSGNAEIISIDGRKCIHFVRGTTWIVPLMKDMKSYLPEEFTIELDFYVSDISAKNRSSNATSQAFWLVLYDEKKYEVGSIAFGWDGDGISWSYKAPDGSGKSGNENANAQFIANSWNHFSLSFNKRALKVYINGVRMANVPNMAAPKNFEIRNWTSDRTNNPKELISNIRVAKGAVPLYDRMMTDGKIISYGITFDIGKSSIKPESMGEINRIVTLMTENPELKFSVEGHTDNTGNANSNQTLSDARSKAVVDKLIEMGIAKDRLQSAGKGQTTPIADNTTDEGRAKNRRVEFVKIN